MRQSAMNCKLCFLATVFATTLLGNGAALALDPPKVAVPHKIADLKQPAMTPAAATQLPPDGLWFAGTTSYNSGEGDSEFYIYQVTNQGIKQAFGEEHTRVQEQIWLDATTLVAMDSPKLSGNDKDSLRLRWFRKGVVAETIDIPASAWKLPSGTDLPRIASLAVLGQQVWLTGCTKFKLAEYGDVCTKFVSLKVDGGKLTVLQSRAPQKARTGTQPPPWPRVKPPLSPTVKLKKVGVNGATTPGFTCTDSGSTMTWPHGTTIDWSLDVRPRRLQWLMTTPALYAVTGPATDPIGNTSTRTRVFRGCSSNPMDEFQWLGSGFWLQQVIHTHPDQAVSHTTWHLHHADQEVAVMLASFLTVAPRATKNQSRP